MNVLVTGGCGFIGSNLVHWLRKNRPTWNIVNLDKLTYAGNLENLAALEGDPKHVFVQGDISNRELVDHVLRTHRIDAVLHLAAESHVDRSILGPEAFITTNVLGTNVLLEAARAALLAAKTGGAADAHGAPAAKPETKPTAKTPPPSDAHAPAPAAGKPLVDAHGAPAAAGAKTAPAKTEAPTPCGRTTISWRRPLCCSWSSKRSTSRSRTGASRPRPRSWRQPG